MNGLGVSPATFQQQNPIVDLHNPHNNHDSESPLPSTAVYELASQGQADTDTALGSTLVARLHAFIQ